MKIDSKYISAIVLATDVIATSVFAMGVFANHVRAEDPSSIQSMVTEQVVAVATVDLPQMRLPQAIKWGIEFGIVPEAEAGNMKFSATTAQGAISALVDSGVERITVLPRMSDLHTQAPVWVATLANDANPEEALEALSSVADMLPIKSKTLAIRGGLIVGGPDQTTVDRWALGKPKRPEFKAVWEELVGYQAALAVFGNKDARRVVREMLPQLPSPFEEATGDLVADRISWGGLKIDLPPKANARVVIHSTDAESAKTCQRLVSAIMKYSVNQTNAEFRATSGQQILDTLKPTVDDNRVLLNLSPFLDKERLVPLLASVRGHNAGPRRQNNLKQVINALFAYESANQSFPPNAIYSDAGRPLLSWRVAILPLLGRQDLYEKFRLNEPWNSAHNLRISRDMPECYADPENEYLNVNWRTTVQLPYGKGMMFQEKEGTKFTDIRDGSSNTIAVVCTDPAKSVYWTKPADWEVDLGQPWNGLKQENEQTVTFAFADGSVHSIPVSLAPEDLRAMLTRDGGEVMNR